MSAGGLIAPTVCMRSRPATMANLARNGAGVGGDRWLRWSTAREGAWRLLDRHVSWGTRVAVIGAGNGDDLPLTRLAARASRLDLFDLDLAALRRARRLIPAELRPHVRLHRCDVTAGAADRITRAVRLGRPLHAGNAPGGPLGAGGYDVVIGDLFYSQLLYPALLDAGVSRAARRRVLEVGGPALTDAVVARMHASAAPGARMIHLHDIVGWWEGHLQPVSLAQILSQDDLEAASTLIARCRQPLGVDPRQSAHRLGARVMDTALWEWPFAAGASYLVRATVTDRPGTPASSGRSRGRRAHTAREPASRVPTGRG